LSLPAGNYAVTAGTGLDNTNPSTGLVQCFLNDTSGTLHGVSSSTLAGYAAATVGLLGTASSPSAADTITLDCHGPDGTFAVNSAIDAIRVATINGS
jgi:hypothetical protein